jgi:hypothetical protein
MGRRAALGGPLWLILTGLLGIGDEDVFDFGGIISAVIGVLIVLPIAGARGAAHGAIAGASPDRHARRASSAPALSTDGASGHRDHRDAGDHDRRAGGAGARDRLAQHEVAQHRGHHDAGLAHRGHGARLGQP